MEKQVYLFSEGNKQMRSLLGGKGANLAEMANIGLPVPPGFTISTDACRDYFKNENQLNSDLKVQIENALSVLEDQTGKTFSGENPLLVSVRSGSVQSMPGMMDTILNLGLNDKNVETLAKISNSEKFAFDSYRRFIQMFSNVVLDIPMINFENELEKIKEKYHLKEDKDLQSDHLKELIATYKEIVITESGEEFQQNPLKQMYMAIEAVFRSWNNKRAKIYRKLHNISDSVGTAVNIQMMVFGNFGDTSGTGVAFTRNPSTGENKLFGEFLMNAQGEDVVAGIRTPMTIDKLAESSPKSFDQLNKAAHILEQHYRNMQDIEFTIENEVFYLLQTRNGKRTAAADIKIAVDMVNENILSKKQAVSMINIDQIDNLLHPTFDPQKLFHAVNIAKGLPASPGAASGHIYFDAKTVETENENGKNCILVRTETSPEDIQGMISSRGILTARGGMTSHAAVVARGMGKCCVSGCSDIKVDEHHKLMTVNGVVYNEGDYISLDGSTGIVYKGEIETIQPEISEDFYTILSWADEYSKMKVYANADTPEDSARAVEFGAKGIGLCRTEHMFFEGERISSVRKMIMAKSDQERESAIKELYPHQREDFKGIFRAMRTYPVNIRLLDPPLHEFLPHTHDEMEQMAKTFNVEVKEIEILNRELSEVNPMMGLRGCRLGLIYPSLYKMQAMAIVTAALEVLKEDNFIPKPEIMVPLVGTAQELDLLRKIILEMIEELDPNGSLGNIRVGTMIEIPRACLVADQIAKHADYFSFGTNDLTQMTYGYSRDDAGTFINNYKDQGILEQDPFQVIDKDGVGSLMKIAIEKGKNANPELTVGVCGEQSGEPNSITFFNTLNMDYISCSPFRIPTARLAAAQAEIKQKIHSKV